MDDLIRRQDAIDALTTECSWTFYDEHGQLTPNGKEILGALKNIPSVDAVEVVRCKDCKHYIHVRTDPGYCTRDGSRWVFRDLDWFCMGGELNGSDGNA